MVLECLYCSFSCIVPVHIWWHQLKVNVFIQIFLIRILEASLSIFESMVLNLWLLGCCIMFHMNWRLIFIHDFSLVLLVWNWFHSHTSPWCIYSLWNILMVICLSGLNYITCQFNDASHFFVCFIINDGWSFIQKSVLLYLFLLFFHELFFN